MLVHESHSILTNFGDTNPRLEHDDNDNDNDDDDDNDE